MNQHHHRKHEDVAVTSTLSKCTGDSFSKGRSLSQYQSVIANEKTGFVVCHVENDRDGCLDSEGAGMQPVVVNSGKANTSCFTQVTDLSRLLDKTEAGPAFAIAVTAAVKSSVRSPSQSPLKGDPGILASSTDTNTNCNDSSTAAAEGIYNSGAPAKFRVQATRSARTVAVEGGEHLSIPAARRAVVAGGDSAKDCDVGDEWEDYSVGNGCGEAVSPLSTGSLAGDDGSKEFRSCGAAMAAAAASAGACARSRIDVAAVAVFTKNDRALTESGGVEVEDGSGEAAESEIAVLSGNGGFFAPFDSTHFSDERHLHSEERRFSCDLPSQLPHSSTSRQQHQQQNRRTSFVSAAVKAIGTRTEAREAAAASSPTVSSLCSQQMADPIGVRSECGLGHYRRDSFVDMPPPTGTAAEPSNGSSRFNISRFASFYTVAVGEIIQVCERRVANASVAQREAQKQYLRGRNNQKLRVSSLSFDSPTSANASRLPGRSSSLSLCTSHPLQGQFGPVSDTPLFPQHFHACTLSIESPLDSTAFPNTTAPNMRMGSAMALPSSVASATAAVATVGVTANTLTEPAHFNDEPATVASLRHSQSFTNGSCSTSFVAAAAPPAVSPPAPPLNTVPLMTLFSSTASTAAVGVGGGAPVSETVTGLLEGIHKCVHMGDAAPMVFIGALAYLSRVAARCASDFASVTPANWYRLTTVAVMVACKMYTERAGHHVNRRFSNASGVPLTELKLLEVDFLYLIDFNLLLDEEDIEKWLTWMETLAVRNDMMTPLESFMLGMPGAATPSQAFSAVGPFSPLSAASSIAMSVPVAAAAATAAAAPSAAFSTTFTCHARTFSAAATTPVASTYSMMNFPNTSGEAGMSGFANASMCSSSNGYAQELQAAFGHYLPSPMLHLKAPAGMAIPPSPVRELPEEFPTTDKLFSTIFVFEGPVTPPTVRHLSRLGASPPSPLPPPIRERSCSPVSFFKRATATTTTTTTVAAAASDLSSSAHYHSPSGGLQQVLHHQPFHTSTVASTSARAAAILNSESRPQPLPPLVPPAPLPTLHASCELEAAGLRNDNNRTGRERGRDAKEVPYPVAPTCALAQDEAHGRLRWRPGLGVMRHVRDVIDATASLVRGHLNVIPVPAATASTSSASRERERDVGMRHTSMGGTGSVRQGQTLPSTASQHAQRQASLPAEAYADCNEAVAYDEGNGEFIDEDDGDEEGYYDEDGYYHYYEDEGYYDEDGYYHYFDEDEVEDGNANAEQYEDGYEEDDFDDEPSSCRPPPRTHSPPSL